MLDANFPRGGRWLLPLRMRGMALAGIAVRSTHAWAARVGAIWPDTREASTFGGFGAGSLICFPGDALVNPAGITIGEATLIAPHVVLSAGWGPGQAGIAPDVLVIGDRCLIGRGSSLIAHERIHIGDDVWTGHHVHITDMNHGTDHATQPISQQYGDPRPVTIGSGSWIGHGAIVLPGAAIGRGCVIGAGSVVTGEIPDHCIAVGSPARVVGQTGAHSGSSAPDSGGRGQEARQ